MAAVRFTRVEGIEQCCKLLQEDGAVTGFEIILRASADQRLFVVGHKAPQRAGPKPGSTVFAGFVEIVRLNHFEIHQPENQPVNHLMTELFDEVAGERRAVAIGPMIEADAGVESGGFHQTLQFASEQGVAEVEKRVDRVVRATLLAALEGISDTFQRRNRPK